MFVIASIVAHAGPTAPNTGGELKFYKNLQKDPILLYSVAVEDPVASFDDLIGFAARLGDEGAGDRFSEALRVLDSRLGMALKDDLLSQIGPEVTLVLDFPPIDQAISAFRFPTGDTLAKVLVGTGVVAAVRDEQQFTEALRKLVVGLGGRLEEGKLTQIEIPLSAPPAGSEDAAYLVLFSKVHKGRIVVGFSREWVLDTVERRPRGTKITDGGDFGTVSSQLDPEPSSLIYVNLPKLRTYFDESQVIQALLETDDETRALVDMLFAPDMMNVGLGSTSISGDASVRTTSFGPSWLSGTSISSGLIAALTLPGMLGDDADKGRTQDTLADMHSIALACEGFSDDVRTYPGPTDGWVPVERIAPFLEPVYIPDMPRIDAWENPILYRSDGATYRILSMGRDGRIDQDWSGVKEPVASEDFDGDIVFADGHLLVVPSPLVVE